MTPAARLQGVIDILDRIDRETSIPADGHMASYFRDRRYIGSKDRGVIATLAYATLRQRGGLDWLLRQRGLPVNARTRVLALETLKEAAAPEAIVAQFSGDQHAPAPLNQTERLFMTLQCGKPPPFEAMDDASRLNVPEWLLPSLSAALGSDYTRELAALNQEAPLDLRVNTLKTTREQALKDLLALGFSGAPTPRAPEGIRLNTRQPVFITRLFKEGHFEVQDEGSQLVALAGGARAGMKVIDFCAGAGGKTLALAAQMQNKGRLLALDTSEHRLNQIKPRLARAGADTVSRHVLLSESDPWLKRHKASADRVLVDAPCTGTGTWRRNPDLKWRTTPEQLAELTALQARILAGAARLVKPGGALVYVTCSLLPQENDEQIAAFLRIHSAFKPATPFLLDTIATPTAHGWQLTPFRHGTDGFYCAVMELG